MAHEHEVSRRLESNVLKATRDPGFPRIRSDFELAVVARTADGTSVLVIGYGACGVGLVWEDNADGKWSSDPTFVTAPVVQKNG